MTILVFDIETVPCLTTGRKLHDLQGLSDTDAASALFALRREKVGHDFLPHHLQRIVAISLVLYQETSITVWSLGNEESTEKELITRFFAGIDKYSPTLVSWNGNGFDLPVLHYRALLHGVSAKTYWEVGENTQSFRFNNYLNRFHYRHLDLMDILAGFQNKAFAPLDEIAVMLGFPGKMGMNGSCVWDQFALGKIKDIRNYCETDVLNTFCTYLRFELIRGLIEPVKYNESIKQLQTYLVTQKDKSHLQDFLMKLKETPLL